MAQSQGGWERARIEVKSVGKALYLFCLGPGGGLSLLPLTIADHYTSGGIVPMSGFWVWMRENLYFVTNLPGEVLSPFAQMAFCVLINWKFSCLCMLNTKEKTVECFRSIYPLQYSGYGGCWGRLRECGESQTSRTRVFHIKRRGIQWYRSQLPIAAYSLLRAVADVSTIFAFSVNIFLIQLKGQN